MARARILLPHPVPRPEDSETPDEWRGSRVNSTGTDGSQEVGLRTTGLAQICPCLESPPKGQVLSKAARTDESRPAAKLCAARTVCSA
jgi:hypothetical protein